MDRDKLTELKIQELISLRQLLTTTITILVGGTIGLIFISKFIIIRLILFVLGLYYTGLFVSNLKSTMSELNMLLKSEEKK